MFSLLLYTGFLADKFGGYKLILIISLIANAFFHSVLLMVPNVQTENYTPLDEIHCLSHTNYLRVNTCEGSKDCQLVLNGTIGGGLKLSKCFYQCGDHKQPVLSASSPLHNSAGFSPFLERSCDGSSNTNCSTAVVPFENATSQVTLRISSACRRIDNTGCSYDIHHIWDPESGGSLSCPKMNSSCQLICPIQLEDNNLAAEKQCERILGNHSLTFWLYLFLRVIASAFLSSCISLLDATTLVMLKEHDGEYGKQRLWSILATAVFPPIAGVLVDYASMMKGEWSCFENLILSLTILLIILTPFLFFFFY